MDFYVFESRVGSPFETSFLPLSEAVGSAPRCPQCDRPVGSLEWLPPYEVEVVAHGSEFGDVAFGIASEFLISARLDAWIVAHDIRGLIQSELVSVSYRGASGSPGPEYYLTKPVLTNVAVAEPPSRVYRQPRLPPECEMCSAAPERIEGFAIDESSWGGEDCFVTTHLLV